VGVVDRLAVSQGEMGRNVLNAVSQPSDEVLADLQGGDHS
jgi:hypothetical protein